MGRRPVVLVAAVVLAVALIGSLAYSEQVRPLSVIYGGISVDGAALDASHRPFTVAYAPSSTIYSGIGLQNESAVPITIEGVATSDGPNASGYRLTGILSSRLGQPNVRSRFRPITIRPHAQASFDIVYTAETRCDLLPAERRSADAGMGVWRYVEIRYSALGVVPRTQVVPLGQPFQVPQPSRGDCPAT